MADDESAERPSTRGRRLHLAHECPDRLLDLGQHGFGFEVTVFQQAVENAGEDGGDDLLDVRLEQGVPLAPARHDSERALELDRFGQQRQARNRRPGVRTGCEADPRISLFELRLAHEPAEQRVVVRTHLVSPSGRLRRRHSVGAMRIQCLADIVRCSDRRCRDYRSAIPKNASRRTSPASTRSASAGTNRTLEPGWAWARRSRAIGSTEPSFG